MYLMLATRHRPLASASKGQGRPRQRHSDSNHHAEHLSGIGMETAKRQAEASGGKLRREPCSSFRGQSAQPVPQANDCMQGRYANAQPAFFGASKRRLRETKSACKTHQVTTPALLPMACLRYASASQRTAHVVHSPASSVACATHTRR